LGLLIIGDVHKLIALCRKVDSLMLQRAPQPFAAIQDAALDEIGKPLYKFFYGPPLLRC
jgi:hypothetical protein